MSERIYRDPVHNIIRLSTDTAEGQLMVRLIYAPEFQRLRRIKQLGLALYTYQGSAEAVLRSILRRALRLLEEGKEVWCANWHLLKREFEIQS